MARKKDRSGSADNGWQKLERIPEQEGQAENGVKEEKESAAVQETEKTAAPVQKPEQEPPEENQPDDIPVVEDIKSWTPKASEIPPEDRIPKKEESAPVPEVGNAAEDEPPPVETIQSWKPKASEIPPEDRVPKPGERVTPPKKEKQGTTATSEPKKSDKKDTYSGAEKKSRSAEAASTKSSSGKVVATMDRRHYSRGGKRKYSAAVPIGGVFVLLAVIGLITVILYSVQATEKLIDNSSEKEKFQAIIQPVLMFDPVPFEDPNEMGELALLRSSIWAAIIQNSGKYTFNDGNQITVPQSDVDVACANLFGPTVTLNHHGFEDYFSIYAYNEETKSYYVPEDASILYTAQVEEVTKKGDTLSLLVGYLAPDNQWMMNLNGEKQEPTPSKYMIYELKKVEDNYQLISIKDPPGGAVPGIPQIQPEEQTPQTLPDTVEPAEIAEPALPMNPEDQTRQEDEEKQNQEDSQTEEDAGQEDGTPADDASDEENQEEDQNPKEENQDSQEKQPSTDNEPETI